ncbi:MAG: 5-guanidino-2-oxopentanoate decarboxylase [Alphaproteobacteria bacterium]|nr:5-guanidino-2-oxopentanoate decarboxylase [Alphaproteobacteria bacterium]
MAGKPRGRKPKPAPKSVIETAAATLPLAGAATAEKPLLDNLPDDHCGAALMHLLRGYGVDTVFGIPGVHTLELYRGIADADLRHITPRNELGAAFMADGYARATGRPGVCTLITGPGLTYAATAIAEAYSDSIPMLVITAVNARRHLNMGRGKLHEMTDQRAFSAPMTGWSHTLHDPDDMPLVIARAFAKFATERPRPIHIEVPIDVMPLPVQAPRQSRPLPKIPAPHPDRIAEAAAVLAEARDPTIILGGGAWQAGAAITALAERLGAVVMSTVAGKGIVPESHPLSAGMCLSDRAVDGRLVNTDVALVIGSELSDADIWIEGPLPLPERTVRIDIDADELQGDYPVMVPVLGDAGLSVDALLERLGPPPAEIAATAGRARAWAAEMKAKLRATDGLKTVHRDVLDTIRQALPDDAMVFNDMTQIAYAGHDLFPVDGPRLWNHPCGFGTLGYAVPAAIGAKIGCPDRVVTALVGDGGLQFTSQELATAVENGLSLPIFVWNNNAYGEIRLGLEDRNIPPIGVNLENPDFIKLAAAYGARANAPTTHAALSASIEVALTQPVPTLIIIDEDKFKPG